MILLSYKDDKDFRKAEEFRCTFDLVDGADYRWVVDYAKYYHESILKVYKELNDKSNEIVKHMCGVVILTAACLVAVINDRNFYVINYLYPTFAASAVSIFFAIVAQKPNPVHFPMTVESAFRIASEVGEADKSMAWTLGVWNKACEASRISVKRKGRRIELATWFSFLAILLLFRAIYLIANR